MTLALIVLGLASLWEIVCWLEPRLLARKAVLVAIVILVAASTTLLAETHPTVWTMLIALASGYRIVNLLRAISGRMQLDYLVRVARASCLWLILFQFVLFGLARVNAVIQLSSDSFWLLAVVGQGAVAVLLFMTTRRHLRTTLPPKVTENFSDKDLPTVTVAIPARNETTDLEACLDTLVDSTYPKLEVIVLDDCSQNQRTPEIIRGYAHDGVRFIAGSVPPDNWLAKNFAYQQLADEANGQILIFCGVDARFERGSIRSIVQTMTTKHKTMVSLIPRNKPSNEGALASALVQPSRYAWELSLPRRFLHRPPVLSTCWVIRSEQLQAIGGFKAVSRSVSPEAFFAKRTAERADGYSFLQSSDALGVSSEKPFGEQRATAIRTRYPQMHRRIELVYLFTILELSSLVLPYIGLFIGLFSGQLLLAGLSFVVCVMTSSFYGAVIGVTYGSRRFLSGLTLPLAVMYDVAILNFSMWKYEFSDVVWKDRNVCIPVMRVIPRLPSLPVRPRN